MPVVALFFLFGTIGTVINWIIAPIRSLEIATVDGFLPKGLVNQTSEPPIKLLIVQAIIVTLLSFIFLIQGDMNQSYWLLSIIPAGLYLFMYLMMFLSYLRLSIFNEVIFSSKTTKCFLISCAILGFIGALFGLYAVLLPPKALFLTFKTGTYAFSVASGICIFTLPAIILMILYKND